ncbi:MAG TPA: hypothetical protein VNQ80_14120 [Parapedobacter sp.]|uniref:hypothetical protein n=1 Tax=Parapedobacter sp. TaxID=1958893 RepID=UPI002BB6C06A|nr:hypothetical protein [Parapedobacter sp.]HWK58476.1 hypothetical protein [Parapedobacter sp.]
MERQATPQFDFTPAGVVQYNDWLNGLAPTQRQTEATLAADGLAEFLEIRFILTEDQLEYAESLPQETADLWSQQIAYAIAHQQPLELIKPGLSIRASTKYIRSESSTSAGDRPKTCGGNDYLRFTISEYPDAP